MAKVDTGARTSALHAFDIEPFMEEGIQRLRFKVHPAQRNTEKVQACVATVTDQRDIRDSGGHQQTRWVIESTLTIGEQSWPIDITLTSRDDMRFRMLLGRSAMKNRLMVNPSKSYLTGKSLKRSK